MPSKFPTEPCFACKQKDWYFQQGAPVCNICHPCPDPALIEETHRLRMEEETEGEKQVLIARCRKGLEVINQAKDQIDELVPEDDDPEREAKNQIHSEEMDRWLETQTKLWGLVKTLNARYNFYGCLYADPWTKKICEDRRKETGHHCWACPKNWEPVIFPEPTVGDPKAFEKKEEGIDLFKGSKW